MKALLCVEHGPPEKLVVTEMPVPSVGPGEVRVRVKAAGVNFPDVLIIQNLYQTKPPLPFIPGTEIAGEVAEVGEGVEKFKVGDRVVGFSGIGGFAEEVVVEEGRVQPLDPEMPYDVAAGFTTTYATSYHALKQRADMQPGETLLVLGAAGGVGLSAVEIGKAMGARVIAAASTAEKLALTKEHGADETINYVEEDFRARLKELTDGNGPDVIYDPVGDKLAEPAFRSIAWGGRHLVIGFAGGEIPKIALNLPLVKGASIIGVFWGVFTRKSPEVHAANMQQLFKWYREGRLKPHLDLVCSLEDGPKALRHLMDRKAKGKVIITP